MFSDAQARVSFNYYFFFFFFNILASSVNLVNKLTKIYGVILADKRSGGQGTFQ